MIYIWDQTALTRYFLGFCNVLDQQWLQADRGDIRLVWPTAVIYAANWEIGARWRDWEPLFIGETVTCAALTESSAIDASPLHPDVIIGQITYEATEVKGLVVSTDPKRYAGLGVAVLPV